MTQVSDEAMRRLTDYSWPGNIRELQNVIERAVILSPGSTLVLAEELRAPAHLGAPAPLPASSRDGRGNTPARMPAVPPTTGKAGALDDVERWHIESILHPTNWVIEGERSAAKILD